MKSLKAVASAVLKLPLDLSRGERIRLKSPTKAIGPEKDGKICSREERKPALSE
jgi:hypothetical protein